MNKKQMPVAVAFNFGLGMIFASSILALGDYSKNTKVVVASIAGMLVIIAAIYMIMAGSKPKK